MSQNLSQPKRPLDRRRFLMLASVGLSGLMGCSGGKGGTGGGSSAPLPAILQPNAVLLPNDGTVQVAGRTENSITLSGTVPALKVGQVLLGTMGEGFMLRVLSSAPDGAGGVVVQTEQAYLEDVFQQLDLRLPEEYDPAGFVDTTPDDPDVQFLPPGRSRVDDSSREFKFAYKHVIAGTKDFGIVGEGSVALKIKTDSQILVQNGVLQIYRYVPTSEVKFQCKVVVAKKSAVIGGRVKLKTLRGPVIYITAIIAGVPVPLPYVPFLDLFLNKEGTFELGVELPLVTMTVRAGCNYTRANGLATVSEQKHTVAPLTLSGVAVFKAAVGPGADLSLRLLGAAGPYLKTDLYTDMEMKAQSNPAGFNLKVGVGIKATVGASVIVGDKNLFQREFPGLVEVRENFYDKLYPSDEGNGPPGCGSRKSGYGDPCGDKPFYQWDCETGGCVFTAPK